MRNRIAPAALMAMTSLACGAEAQSACGLSRIATHGDAHTPIFASTAGEKVIFFAANLDVNTDGAARSYHPDDPRGRSLALNNMGNAITRIFDRNGQDITCTPRQGACYTRFIETFEQSRDAGYAPSGAPRFETTHIIPWKQDASVGHEVPCTISSGPYAGHFVSQTGFIVNRNADVCDQSRYLDALTINAIVLPRNTHWESQGTVTDDGDLVVTRDNTTGKIAYAINGDRGPAQSIGEGTVALAAALGGGTVPPGATYDQIKMLKRSDVQYLIFASRDVPRMTGGSFDQEDIDRLGKEALDAFGGEQRLRACAQ